jgi:crotonobetainyl-CoA:carnitine CoA-transferase CaiB-like acyl-CoA transferase
MNDADWRPLDGLIVVDLTRYIPGPFASRELLRRGARVIRLEAPEGDPTHWLAPGWHEALNAGKESVDCDLKADPAFGRALCARADVVLEGFRPGVVERLGIGPDQLPDTIIYCSITGFGQEGTHALRAGHDLNYLGFAGVLAETAPAMPPIPIADIAAGALAAVQSILLALYDRARTGRGRRLDISMTHQSHRLASYHLGNEAPHGLLTGSFACYRIYTTADHRFITLAALEPRFFARVCELIGRPELAVRQFDPGAQTELTAVLTQTYASRPLAEWLHLFDTEDVAVGAVSSLDEASIDFGVSETSAPAPRLGEHTARWRAELGW